MNPIIHDIYLLILDQDYYRIFKEEQTHGIDVTNR